MYLQNRINGNLFIIIVIVLQVAVHFVNGALSFENKDLYKVKLDPTRSHLIDVLKQMHKERAASNKSDTNIKKWQVGRVSRKQYEIINMLWRKTKDDVEMSTNNYHSGPNQDYYRLPSRLYPTLTSPTSSFIEFYYLDENDERLIDSTWRHQPSKKTRVQQIKNTDILGSGKADYPSFAFHINDPNYIRVPLPTKHSQLRGKKTHETLKTYSPIPNTRNKRIPGHTTGSPDVSSLNDKIIVTESHYVIDNETCPYTDEVVVPSVKETTSTYPNTHSSDLMLYHNWSKPTTIYDKIKFFETYDKNTPPPNYDKVKSQLYLEDVEEVINGNKLSDEQKNISVNIDQTSANLHNKRDETRHVKKNKDIIQNNKVINTEKNISKLISTFNITTVKKIYVTKLPLNDLFSSESKVPKITKNIINNVAVWADYSFMAVYIYEPSQVHCDAAGISPHWLITSGSCLSRHHKNPSGEGRSAFVAYCGSAWWNAERVAYVKYSVVHPRYHQRDKNRKYMYNIGLIQVVISMSTCPGWAPVSLMSHRFAAAPEGSTAYAIGWGLDRYDTQYSSGDLPKYPLMAYENRVFSDRCPGNTVYTQDKRLAEDDVCNNVYCLSLPPYAGEVTDPIHGSMLLVGGKLCAIYLQEERRPSGDQSAEYTGTWRLVPWVSHIAREPSDREPFAFVI